MKKGTGDVPVPDVYGIDLANYYLSTRSYNSVVYVHKKFLNNIKQDVLPAPEINIEKNCDSKPIHKEPINKSRSNKPRRSKANIEVAQNVDQTSVNNDVVLGQTIRFAKNIVPVVIPPDDQDTSPVYYTINTSRKSRVTKVKPRDSNLTRDLTYEKQKRKRTVETFRKDKYNCHTDSISKESVSRSSKENMSDTLPINHSMSCSLSEISKEKLKKNRNSDKRLSKPFVASESFEALATDLLNNSGDKKIKIHLMNDTAKDLLYESIRLPIIEAIKESMTEIINQKDNSECITVHKYVQCHTQKLDNILDKLTCIEKRLDYVEEKAKTQKIKACKASALEQIGEDMVEGHEKSSSDEDTTDVYSTLEQRQARCTSAVVKLHPIQNNEEKVDLGGGEDLPGPKPSAMPKIVSDRPNRIPARYCWTDSTK